MTSAVLPSWRKLHGPRAQSTRPKTPNHSLCATAALHLNVAPARPLSGVSEQRSDALGLHPRRNGNDPVHLAQDRLFDQLPVNHHEPRIGGLKLRNDPARAGNLSL